MIVSIIISFIAFRDIWGGYNYFDNSLEEIMSGVKEAFDCVWFSVKIDFEAFHSLLNVIEKRKEKEKKALSSLRQFLSLWHLKTFTTFKRKKKKLKFQNSFHTICFR